jgi:hypothetical protein
MDIAGTLLRHMWAQARNRDSKDWPPWWLIAAALALLIVVLFSCVAPLLRSLTDLAIRIGDTSAAWIHHWALAQAVLTPVHHYLTVHAAQFPVPAPSLWWTWCTAGIVLFVLAAARTVAGRIGWTAYGVATAGMVWAATPAPSRWIGAGIAALWWTLLSLPALRRYRVAPPLVTVNNDRQDTPAAPDPDDTTVAAPGNAWTDLNPRDDAARLAGLYERLTRSHQVRGRLLPPSQTRWQVTSEFPQAFIAHDGDGRPAAGRGRTVEAVTELLAGLSTPPGVPPVLHWTGASVGTWVADRLPYDQPGYELPGLYTLLQASTRQRQELATALREARSAWDLDRLNEQIQVRAEHLNRTHPLTSVSDFVPQARWWHGEDLGNVETYGWIDPATVIGGNAASWNDFADHRPQMVRLIIQKLLTAEDVDTAACEVLSDDSIVFVDQAHGPAGPIHQVTVNGTHRTHALRLLGAPLLAARIAVTPLPTRLHEGSLRGPTAISAELIWRGLIDRGLLYGDIIHGTHATVLEPHHVAATWLLCPPHEAAAISAAYQRIYPGSLDIPPAALEDGNSWCQWLTS